MKTMLDSFFSRRALVLTCVFFLALIPRLYNLSAKSVWLDEEAQARHSRSGPFSFELVHLAAVQQQPPLDYYLQSVGIRIFGLTERGVRIHAAVTGALATALFTALLLQLGLHPCIIGLATFFFAGHPLLVRYSQEGRPISLAVCCSVLYLGALLRYLQAPLRPNALPHVLWSATLAFVQWIFLLSAGFQPVIFLATSAAALAPLLLLRPYRTRVLIVYLSEALAFLCAWPVLKAVAHESKRFLAHSPYVRQVEPTALIHDLLQAFQGALTQGPAEYYRALLGTAWLPFCAVLLLCLWLLVWRFRQGDKIGSADRRPLFLYTLVFALAFPLLFETVFRAVVRWGLSVRYYLTLVPLLLLSHALALDLLLRHAQAAARRRRAWRALPAGVCLLGALAVLPPTLIELPAIYAEPKTDWRALYARFRTEPAESAHAYLLQFVRPDRWASGFVALDFYYPQTDPRPVLPRGGHDILAGDYARTALADVDTVYLVFRHGAERIDPAWFAGRHGLDIAQPHGLFVAVIRTGTDARARVKAFLYELLGHLPPSLENHFLLRLLCRMELVDGHLPEARVLLDRLQALDRDGLLDDDIAELAAQCAASGEK